MDRETEALAKLIVSIIKRENMDEQYSTVWWDEIGYEIGLLMDDPEFKPDESLLDPFKHSYDGYIPITYITKDDIKATFEYVGRSTPEIEVVIDNLDDSDMWTLASKMADDYVSQLYWGSLRFIFEEYFL